MCALKRVHMPCVARLQKVGLADRNAVSSSHGLSSLGELQIKRTANAMRKVNHTRTRALETDSSIGKVEWQPSGLAKKAEVAGNNVAVLG